MESNLKFLPSDFISPAREVQEMNLKFFDIIVKIYWRKKRDSCHQEPLGSQDATSNLVLGPIRAIRMSGGGLEPNAIVRGLPRRVLPKRFFGWRVENPFLPAPFSCSFLLTL